MGKSKIVETEYEHVQIPVDMVETVMDLFKERDVIEFNFKELTLKTYRKNNHTHVE